MKNKTTKTLFTKEFIDNLQFLIKNQNAVKEYEENLTYHGRGGLDPDGYWTYSQELKDLAEKFEDLFAEVKQQINDYFNTDFKELYDFLEENRSTNYCDLEANLIECLETYIAD